MCWVSNKLVKQVAEEDIPVFKVIKQYNKALLALLEECKKMSNCVLELELSDPSNIKEGLLSLYKNFEYKEGETYTSNIVVEQMYIPTKDILKYQINEGLHSYSPKCEILIGNHCWNDKTRVAIVVANNNIVLASLNIYSDRTLIKADCVIPKGAEYYLNENGEYVSNKIKIVKCVKTIE